MHHSLTHTLTHRNASSISECDRLMSSSTCSTASVAMAARGRKRLLRLFRPTLTTCAGGGEGGGAGGQYIHNRATETH